MGRAILIPADNTVDITEVDVDLNDFRAVAKAIGSEYIEGVRIMDPDHYLFVDETGRVTGKPLNGRASLLYRGGPLCGDVLLTGGEDAEGNTLPAAIALELIPAWILENAL